MSLETAIENLTAAILAQTEADKHNFDRLYKSNAMLVEAESQPPEKEEITTDRSEMKKAAAARKVVKPVEPDPEPEAVEEVYELVEEEIEPEPEQEPSLFPPKLSTWPEGKRKAFYQEHIYPFTSKLQVLDKDALIKMVRSEFNSVRGGFEVDCDKWEAMLARTKELIDEIETVNAVTA